MCVGIGSVGMRSRVSWSDDEAGESTNPSNVSLSLSLFSTTLVVFAFMDVCAHVFMGAVVFVMCIV